MGKHYRQATFAERREIFRLRKVEQQSLSVIAAVEYGQKIVVRFTGVRRTIYFSKNA